MPNRCANSRSASGRFPIRAAARGAATLCGMRGYKAIFDWAIALGQQARERFDCRRENGRYVVPSKYVIRDGLVRIEPGALDRALTEWNRA